MGMRKAVVLTLASVGTLMALGVGGTMATAAYTGGKVLQSLDQQTDALLKAFPSFSVVDKSLVRGPFSSTRDLTLQLGCLPLAAQQAGLGTPGKSEPVQLHWRDVIHHGPLPGGAGVAFATIDSELVSPPAWKARIDKVTGNQPILTVHTVVPFSGELSSDVQVPALHFVDPASGSLETKPLLANVRSHFESDPLRGGVYDTKMAGFELRTRANDGTSLTIKLGALAGRTEILPRSDAALWFGPSKASARLDAMELLGTAGTALPIKPVQAVFSQLRFDSDSKLEQGLFSSTSKVSGTGIVNQVPVDKLELTASMRRVHAATYQQMLTRLLGTVFSCDSATQQTDPAAMLSAVEKDLAALLVHNPEYALDKLAVELKGRRAELSYSLGTQGVTADDAALPLPALLLSKGVLRIGARVHTGLLAQAVKQLGLVDPAAAAGLPTQGATKEDPALSFVNGMIDQFSELGYVEREGELIKTSASYEAGQVLVNGKPMALPDLGALTK
jgi:uncharacterized protein YdgA (DUF945 family)